MALAMIVASSFLALTAQYGDNQWDPIREIQQLKIEHRRDDAIDLVNFLKENQTHETDDLHKIEKEVAYSPLERAKAFVWDGVVKGNVNDTYSGMVPWLLIFVYTAISVTLPSRPGICCSTRTIRWCGWCAIGSRYRFIHHAYV